MEIHEALAQAMAEAGMRDEHVALETELSVQGIRDIRLGYQKRPRRSTLAALKRAVPGFEERLNRSAVA